MVLPGPLSDCLEIGKKSVRRAKISGSTHLTFHDLDLELLTRTVTHRLVLNHYVQ